MSSEPPLNLDACLVQCRININVGILISEMLF